MPILKPIRGIRLDKNHPLARGLIFFPPFNEGTGIKISDSSVSGKIITLYNSPIWTPGKAGYALEWNASEQYGTLNEFTVNDFTLVVGFYNHEDSGDTPAQSPVFASDNYDATPRYVVQIKTANASNNHFECKVNNIGGSVTHPFTKNQWHHATMVRRGTTCDCYAEGIDLGIPITVGSGPFTFYNPRIGAQYYQGANQKFFDGLIEYILIYDRALSTSERLFLYRELSHLAHAPISPAILSTVAASPQRKLPTGDSSVQWTPSSGGNNWAMVDDPVGNPDDDTTYNQIMGSVVKRDYFNFTAFSIPDGVTINSVKVVGIVKRVGVEPASYRLMSKVNGVTYEGDSDTLTQAYAEYSYTWTTNPDTGSAWTVDDVNGIGSNPLQTFGYKLEQPLFGETVRCTQVYIEVDYSEAADVTITPDTFELGLTLETPEAGPPQQERLPTADSSVQWNRSAGNDNWALVDDPVGNPDYDGTYNYMTGATVKRDLFSFTAFSVPAGAAIQNVKVVVVDARLAADQAYRRLLLRVNNTTYEGANAMPSQAYGEYTETWANNPNTGSAWTVDDVNGIGSNPIQTFGYKFELDSFSDIRCTQAYIKVNYIVAVDVTITPNTFELGLTLETPEVVVDVTITPSTFELGLTLETSTLRFDYTVTPSAFELGLALETPAVKIDCTVLPATFELGLTQPTSAVIIDYTVLPATFELGLTLQTSTLTFDYTVSPLTFELGLTLEIPTISTATIVTPSVFELALTQETSSILFSAQTMLPDAFELALTQETPAIIIDCTVLPSTFELALTQETPSIDIIVTVLPSAFELALELQTPVVTVDITITPSTFALGLTLETLSVSVDLVIITPDTFELALTQLVPGISAGFFEIPPFMHKDLIDPYSGGAWLWLVEIVIPEQTTQRIARNTADVIYGGTDFPKGNFEPPKQSSSGDGSVPKVVLRVAQDRDRVLENIINASKGGTNGTVKIIRTCEKFLTSPIAELEAEFDILTAGSNAEWVTLSLGMPSPLIQRIPLWLYSSKLCPYATPSLFKGVRCQYTGGDSTCTGLLEDCFTKGNIVHWGAEIGLDPSAVRV